MFRQVSRVALAALTALGILTPAMAMSGGGNQPGSSPPDVKTRETAAGSKTQAVPRKTVKTQETAAASKTQAMRREIAVDLGKGVKLEMVLIPAGEFLMGSPDSDQSADQSEKPRHRVRITRPFFLGKYEVTQQQWEAVMGGNPSYVEGPKHPVEQVSWEDCRRFLDKLNMRRDKQAGKFQLPTEAQWEYACRGGSTAKYCFGDDEARLGDYAWYDANSKYRTHPVGQKKPNAFGLYDMHGNVQEWCADWRDAGYYAKSPADDPRGPATGSARVRRGGSVHDPARVCRSAGRNYLVPGESDLDLGLRVCRVAAE